MATHDTQKPGTQPAEDMFGRPTAPRHDEPATRPVKDAPGQQAPGEEHSDTRKSTGEEHSDTRKSTGEEDDEPRREGIDELPDGDGPRSDRGNNPLPDTYWANHPGGKS
ncbi:hypothetical protein [Hyalangium versicolor]|uniref:hypothetical protein n=1 Tax=Hyalangium versicolor TaxID=2861190 RepID=UPI001CCEB6AA|nr:hypothetical protein [Hyalangium versicolor]